jgi:Icc-related predicted phosphoesterase
VARSRVYFITDVHGSNKCFRKFLNAAKFYKADTLILGGDITGKVLTPVVESGGGSFKCTFQGEDLSMSDLSQVEEFRKRAAELGVYTQIVSQGGLEELEADPRKVTELFRGLIVERVREWVSLAEERLRGTPVKCFISPGNDDIFEIDPLLSSSQCVVNPEARVVEIDGEHEMITLGYTNHTPWNSPREVDEDELAARISVMAERVRDMKSAIFNIHVPPIDTLIDQAPRVDGDLKIVVKAGNVEMVSAGSSACRASIMRYQPMLGLHGHIHESRGVVKLGRTLCANPGSEYTEGILRGFLSDLEGDKVRSYLLTSG